MSILDTSILFISRNLPNTRGINRISGWLQKIYLRQPRKNAIMDLGRFKMDLDLNTNLERDLFFIPQAYEVAERRFMDRYMPTEGTFLDVGTNIGYYSLYIASNPDFKGRVIGIEAEPGIYKKAKRNIEVNALTNIKLLNVGVSDKEEELTFHVHPTNLGGNSFLQTFEQKPTDIKVACRPLLDLLKEQGVTEIAMMKIDIEGFEFRVLKAFFSDAPKSMWPAYILTEFHTDLVEIAGGHLVDLLQDSGYELISQKGINYFLKLKTS